MYRYKTHGTCSREMLIEMEGNRIKELEIIGGCRGNTQALCRLVKGMDADEAIARLRGIRCQGDTSCPDQLSYAIEECRNAGEKAVK
ncbi:MAG: TIGR03905 family TSCPD domain-containing protein [Eubacteriales bacterium]|nr:TIGR03905 family TSCPD domain-containing protein [Eubacteriales bacterium]